jgi:hypothetical protein
MTLARVETAVLKADHCGVSPPPEAMTTSKMTRTATATRIPAAERGSVGPSAARR